MLLALGTSSVVVLLFLLVASDPHLYYPSHKQVWPYKEARGPI